MLREQDKELIFKEFKDERDAQAVKLFGRTWRTFGPSSSKKSLELQLVEERQSYFAINEVITPHRRRAIRYVVEGGLTCGFKRSSGINPSSPSKRPKPA